MGERMTIVGTRYVSFDDDKTGRKVEGKTFYYNQARDGVDGLVSDKVFVSSQALRDIGYEPKPGDEVYAYFNRYGKVSSFELV